MGLFCSHRNITCVIFINATSQRCEVFLVFRVLIAECEDVLVGWHELTWVLFVRCAPSQKEASNIRLPLPAKRDGFPMQVPKTEPADRLFKVDTSFNRITYGKAANSPTNLNLDIQGVAVFTSSSKRNERNVPAIPLQLNSGSAFRSSSTTSIPRKLIAGVYACGMMCA